MLNKETCLQAIARRRSDEIVVTTMSAASIWGRVSGHELDFASIGSAMGHAADLALGLALARPDKKVIVLNGDGSMLMSLGTLVTVIASGARNLMLFLLENDTYEITGNQPLPAAGKVSFPGLAAAAGFKRVFDFVSQGDLDRNLPEIMSGDGPVFVNLRLERGQEPVPVRSPNQTIAYLSQPLHQAASGLRAHLASESGRATPAR
jgi:sulfopyruvate decarboxylase subunit beta